MTNTVVVTIKCKLNLFKIEFVGEKQELSDLKASLNVFKNEKI